MGPPTPTAGRVDSDPYAQMAYGNSCKKASLCYHTTHTLELASSPAALCS